MKTLRLFLFALSFLVLGNGYAQTLYLSMVNCNELSVSAPNPGVDYPVDVYNEGRNVDKNCSFLIGSKGPLQPQYVLQKQEGTQWLNVRPTTLSRNWTNLSTGRYRVYINLPIYDITWNCTTSPYIPAINILGQQVGYRGTYHVGAVTTNEVYLGPTTSDDLSYTMIDVSGGNNLPNGYDYGELVFINTNAKNYTGWFLAIFELGGAQRYWSQGWRFDAMPTQLPIRDLWAENGWQLESLNSYRIQLAIANGCNTVWTGVEKDFFVCPQGSGCKGVQAGSSISISPNPASQRFEMKGLSEDVLEQGRLTLHDVSGRELKVFNNLSNNTYDVADLPNGLYIVNVWKGEKRISTSKLSIVK